MTRAVLCAAGLIVTLASTAFGQTATPLPRKGTMAIPAGNDKLYDAGEAAAEGVAHVVRAVKDRFGDKAPLVDPLGGLLEGTTVVVRDGPPLSDTAANDEESDRTGVSEATVIQIEKTRVQLTLRYDDGKKAVLHLASGIGTAKNASTPTDVLSLTYKDDAGRKTTRVFTKLP